MEPILTRCGYRCDLCLAYRPNVERNPANQQVLSDGWFTYFGFRIPPEKIVCDGCLSTSADASLLDAGCPVRPCVIARGLDNCAACPEYGCEKLQQRRVVYEEIRERMDAEIPDADRQRFILPYENIVRLDALRGATDR